MSSQQLHKLEKLAAQRADHSRDSLARGQQELTQMDRQSNELRTINQEYQQSLLGDREVSPQVLAHRRAFVENLTQKLEALSEQRAVKKRNVQKQAVEHQHRTAQHAAIELVNEHRTVQRDQASAYREQQQLDSNSRSQHIQRQHNEREQGND